MVDGLQGPRWCMMHWPPTACPKTIRGKHSPGDPGSALRASLGPLGCVYSLISWSWGTGDAVEANKTMLWGCKKTVGVQIYPKPYSFKYPPRLLENVRNRVANKTMLWGCEKTANPMLLNNLLNCCFYAWNWIKFGFG